MSFISKLTSSIIPATSSTQPTTKIGGLISAGGSILTGNIGGAITGLISSFLPKLSENVNRVMQYGLSSWKSSTTPEKMQPAIKMITEKSIEIAQTLTQENINVPLNELERYIRGWQVAGAHQRRDHAKASATKKALDALNLATADLYQKLVKDTISTLTQAGAKITSIEKTERISPLVVDSSFTLNPEDSTTYKVYNVDISHLPKDKSTGILQTTGTNTMGGLGMIALLGAGLFFGMKKFR